MEVELDLVQIAVAALRRLDPADDPLKTPAGVIEDELDRLHALGGSPGNRAAAADKLGALGCAAAGEPDRAAGEGVKALDIAQRTGSDMIVRELKRLDRQLAASDRPEATNFREAFATL